MASIGDVASPRPCASVTNFASGSFGQWFAEHSGSAADPTITTWQGVSAMKCDMQTTAWYRSEVSDPRVWMRMRPGTTVYYSLRFWLVAPWPTGAWQILHQWQHNINNGGDAWDTTTSPPLTLQAGSTDYSLGTSFCLTGGDTDWSGIGFTPWAISLGSILTDQWVTITVKATMSETLAENRLTAWLNGSQVVDQQPPSKLIYPTTNTDRYNYFKFGCYRDSAISSSGVVYYDSVRIGGTYQAVT